uniref:Protein kinase domain-containing protein n=1 Tax=Salix viminalis TaxID=40686 RepID=A0A6N2MH64_SALVM
MVLFISCIKAFHEAKLPGSASEMYNSSEGPLFTYGASFDNEKTQREQVNENAKHCDAHPQLGEQDQKEWLHNEKLAIESKRKESPFFTRREKFKNEFLRRIDFGEDESESDDSAGSVEETCSESEVEDDNDAVNEEEWTSSAEAKSDCRDYDAVDLEANAQAALKKLLPCSLEEFEKLSDRRYYTAYRPMQIGGVVWSDLGMHFLRDVSLISTLRSGIGDNTMIQECLKEETSDDDVIGDRVKYIGPSIRIEADDRCLFISLFLAYKDDDNPPIPDSLSPDITDFLRQCFKKDATQRPDAKTLLSHPWILKSKPALNSFRHSGAIRSVQEDVSVDTVILNGDKQGTDQNSSVDKTEASVAGFEAVSRKQLLTESDDVSKSCKDNSSNDDEVEERTDKLDNDLHSDQVPTLAIHEKSSLKTSSGRLSMNKVAAACAPLHGSTDMHDQDQALSNGDMESPDVRGKNIDRRDGGKTNSTNVENESFVFATRSQDNGLQKAVKTSMNLGGNELSKFSDTPRDASLDDLFHPLDKNPEDRAAEASTSASTSHMNQGNAVVVDAGKNDLATRLRATIAQKQMENEMGRQMAVDGVIDIDGLVFDEKLPPENLFPLQAVEFSRLVGLLRPEESEEKLISIFHQRPEQKIVFITQHGLLPLMELLEVPKTRIPVVMSFAGPDRPRIRTKTVGFLVQLVDIANVIACRGIPILVGFLEADHAKYRDMVHLAIDGMWQVFKLQRSTPRNDFCCIAAKNGILFRLVNTLYSLNEATRLASISVGTGISLDGLAQRPRSGPLDSNHPIFNQSEPAFSASDQPDILKFRHGMIDHSLPSVTLEPSRASTSHSQRLDAIHPDARYLGTDTDGPQSSNETIEAAVSSKLPDPAAIGKAANMGIKEPAGIVSKEQDTLDQWKSDPSRPEIEFRQPRVTGSTQRTSTDRPPKLIESASNGLASVVSAQSEQVRPLLSLLEKEPSSKHFSGQLEYARHLSGLERHESILPLLHASEKKTNGELDFLMTEFAEVSGRGRENGNLDSMPRISHKTVGKKVGAIAPNEGAASTSGIVSQTASGRSATSSGLLSQMVSAEVAREYLEKVADLLLEFSQADTSVKSYMCSQSLLNRLFQMFNRIELPILLKILKCIDNLSTDPNCLENLQRADAIKYLIPNLELKDGPLVDHIHSEEQAAENGIIPHLMNFIMSDSPLKPHALPLLCDMAHASLTALDSIAVCLAHDNDNHKVEQALLKRMQKSSRINTTLAVNGLTPLLIARLDHQDAIARLNLLKLIKVKFATPYCPVLTFTSALRNYKL